MPQCPTKSFVFEPKCPNSLKKQDRLQGVRIILPLDMLEILEG